MLLVHTITQILIYFYAANFVYMEKFSEPDGADWLGLNMIVKVIQIALTYGLALCLSLMAIFVYYIENQ